MAGALSIATGNARATVSRTFDSLVVRNYRLYFTGQVISLAGTWMQQVAQAILVLRLTDSGTALGAVFALQMLPVLLLGAWAGVVSDRLPKRQVLVATQSAAGCVALVLGLLVATDVVRLWMVYVLALMLGLVQTFDNPTRQSFVSEMVGPERLPNAVSLNSVMVNLARVVGPGMAGIVTAAFGLSVCFLLNAVSYVAVVIALMLMRQAELVTPPPRDRHARLRDGLAYVGRTPAVLVPLILMAIIGMFAYEFQVSLPLLAKRTFQGGDDLYGWMSALQGAGAVVGGLLVAARFRARSPLVLSKVSFVFGLCMLGVALAPTLGLALGAVTLMGASSIMLIAIGNTTLQPGADPIMRGRVMALWSVAFMGSTPIGAPIVGWIGDVLGARYSVAIGGVAAMTAALAIGPALKRLPTLD